MTGAKTIYDKLYAMRLRQRDELRYRIEQYIGWTDDLKAELAAVEAEITKMEIKETGIDGEDYGNNSEG